jgi:hypothetical protein
MYVVRLEGIIETGNEADYPVIYCSTITNGPWFNISSSYPQQLGFKKLKLLYPTGGLTGYFFFTYCSVDVVNLTDCFVFLFPILQILTCI